MPLSSQSYPPPPFFFPAACILNITKTQILTHFSNSLSCQIIEIKKKLSQRQFCCFIAEGSSLNASNAVRFSQKCYLAVLLFSCYFSCRNTKVFIFIYKKNCESKIDKKHPGKSISLLLFLILCWKQTLLFFFHTHDMWNFYVFKHIWTKIPFCLKILFKKTFC